MAASHGSEANPIPESLGSDLDLWNRAREGDLDARSRLASLAQNLALQELRRRGAPSRELQDLAQEAVRSTLAFLARAREGETPRDLRAFLKFRAWGVLSDHRKKMRAAKVQFVDAEGAQPPAREQGPEGFARVGQLREALADCRRRLGTEMQIVLELRYEQGLESEAITSRLGVHRNTVHVRVFRALQELGECLRRKGFDAGDLA